MKIAKTCPLVVLNKQKLINKIITLKINRIAILIENKRK